MACVNISKSVVHLYSYKAWKAFERKWSTLIFSYNTHLTFIWGAPKYLKNFKFLRKTKASIFVCQKLRAWLGLYLSQLLVLQHPGDEEWASRWWIQSMHEDASFIESSATVPTVTFLQIMYQQTLFGKLFQAKANVILICRSCYLPSFYVTENQPGWLALFRYPVPTCLVQTTQIYRYTYKLWVSIWEVLEVIKKKPLALEFVI